MFGCYLVGFKYFVELGFGDDELCLMVEVVLCGLDYGELLFWCLKIVCGEVWVWMVELFVVVVCCVGKDEVGVVMDVECVLCLFMIVVVIVCIDLGYL